jgi:hypothetical protein
MIFATFEPYYNDDILVSREINVCFICYENLDESLDDNDIINLNNKIHYIKTCNCEGYIHKKCLDKWYDTTNSCPICRTVITKLEPVTSKIFSSNLYIGISYVFCLKNINKFKKCMFFLFCIYFTSEFYLKCIEYHSNKNYGYNNSFFKNITY